MDTTKNKNMGHEITKVAHTNCESLSIWAFYKVMETQDLTYLLKDKEVDTDIDLPEIWDKIVEEYQALTNSSSDLILWRLRVEIAKLEVRLQRVTIGCKMYFHFDLNKESEREIIDNLKTDNVFLKGRSVVELDRINSQLQSMANKIKIKELELDQMTPEKAMVQDIYEQIYLIGKITDVKYKLDPKETSVKEFTILSKHATKMSNNGK